MKKKIIAWVSLDSIEDRIYFIRKHKVMLDSDLAQLYHVSPKRLNEQVRRNKRRFPVDFMFQLTKLEARSLRSQFATLKKPQRGRYRKYSPYVFTEQGIAMLSGILHSARAVEVNIALIRVFVQMRKVLSENKELADKLAELENKLVAHDYQIKDILTAIQKLMRPPRKNKLRIGFEAV